MAGVVGALAVDADLDGELEAPGGARAHEAPGAHSCATESLGRNARPWPSSAIALRPSAMSVS
jgi:hypothetical protein